MLSMAWLWLTRVLTRVLTRTYAVLTRCNAQCVFQSFRGAPPDGMSALLVFFKTRGFLKQSHVEATSANN